MTLELIHRKAQKLRAQTQLELVSNLLIIPLSAAIAWFGFVQTHDPAFRLAFVAAVAWAVVGQFLIHRGMWSAIPPERSALTTGFDFYRRELTRRRNLLGRFLQWNLGPVILCIATLILLLTGMARGAGKAGAVLPFTTLGVIWLAAAFVLRSRHQRELKDEIDMLNRIEKTGNKAA